MTNEANATAHPDYPPLPEPHAWETINNINGVSDFGKLPRQSIQPGVYSHARLFTVDQMRAYVDADRASRAQAAQDEIARLKRERDHAEMAAEVEAREVDRLGALLKERGAQAAPPILSSVRLHNAWANGFRAALAWRQSVDEFWKDNEFGKAPREPENPYKVSVSGVAAKGSDAQAAQAAPNDSLRAELVSDLREVFDADGVETPQLVRDIIEYADSWLSVFIQKRAESATPSAPVAPATVPPSLPEPDFALDGGSVGCYYESTVRRLLATQPAEGASAQEDASRWREHVGKLDALVAYCPTCCQGFAANPDMTRDEVIFECGKAAGLRDSQRKDAARAQTVPTNLPEPDFTLDGGSVRCYYESTVRRLIAARHSEGALGMVAGAPAQEDALTYERIIAAWNTQADEYNQWDCLGEDEKIEWAVRCAQAKEGDTYVQQVPDKCDRIVWRDGYYHLPLEATPSQDVEDTARLDWLLLHVSGNEFRRIGVHYSGNARRADVDAAMAQDKEGT